MSTRLQTGRPVILICPPQSGPPGTSKRLKYIYRPIVKKCIMFSSTSPSFAYVSNPAPDSSVESCCSSIASTSANAPRLHHIKPLPLLLPVYVCFSCCSPIASGASTAAPRLRPALQLLLPDCVRRFNCCSLIASGASTAAPLLVYFCIYMKSSFVYAARGFRAVSLRQDDRLL